MKPVRFSSTGKGNTIKHFACFTLVFAIAACSIPRLAGASEAVPRFGDSTWVAPGSSFDGDPTSEGPRVARRDHERRWETALRAPFRVAFFPLRLVARGLEEGVGRFGGSVMSPGPKHVKKGLSVAPAIDIGGVTEAGVGPSFTWAGFPSGDSKLHLSGTWSTIDRRRVQLSERIGDRRPVGFLLRAAYDYKPNLKFYGIGNETPTSNKSIFLLESTNAEATLHFGASPLRQLRLVGGYSAMSPRRGYQGTPRLEEIFPPGSLPGNHRATEEALFGATGDFAALDDRRNPSAGVHARGEFRRAAGIRAQDPDYNQWLVEGRAYAPVFAKRRVLALRGVYTGVGPIGDSVMPFYRLIQTDADVRFAGYPSHRFRDRQLLLGRVEYRWEVWHSVRAVALYELGEVAPGAKAFTARAARWSYGGGVRCGVSEEETFRIEVAESVEGLQATLAIERGF